MDISVPDNTMQTGAQLRHTVTPPVPPGAVDFGAVRTLERVLTALEVAALHTTPIELLAAMGVGMVILPLAVTFEKSAGTANTGLGSYRVGTSTSAYDGAILLDHADFDDQVAAVLAVAAEMPSGIVGDDPTDASFDLCSNSPLLIDSDTALTAADYTVTVRVSYLVLQAA